MLFHDQQLQVIDLFINCCVDLSAWFQIYETLVRFVRAEKEGERTKTRVI